MKTAVTTYTSQIDSFLYRFHSGEYQMLNGNGTDFDINFLTHLAVLYTCPPVRGCIKTTR